MVECLLISVRRFSFLGGGILGRIKKIGFIGAGKVGSALALLLQENGYEIVGIASRTPASAEKLANRLQRPVLTPGEVARRSEAVFITTTDDAIPQVVSGLAAEGSFRQGQIVLHTSGALTAEVLAPAAVQGAITLSLHPLQSFATVEQALAILPGSYFSIEGDRRGFPFAQEVVEKLKGKYFYLDSAAKVLYHAAACVASNYLVGLLACALDLLAAAGIPEGMRLPAMLPLVTGTLDNVRKIGIPNALTGPLARGDLGTVEKHLQALQELPEQEAVYNRLGLYTLKVALAKGTITEDQGRELRNLLEKGVGGKFYHEEEK
ncbi:MAG: Putative NAD(P) dependent oxidoreductase [Thermacetogenium phaeum]|uniref:Putative NAD(P) dependent oxidoreductase n=1 Tax=Thermacetogenium phaeum TaxID=85874 RepID=A0A124FKA2_9THEO|nr:MAG: Putative NAD(P) dependent oxidoreductase [Thermacetogenium phaeum]